MPRLFLDVGNLFFRLLDLRLHPLQLGERFLTVVGNLRPLIWVVPIDQVGGHRVDLALERVGEGLGTPQRFVIRARHQASSFWPSGFASAGFCSAGTAAAGGGAVEATGGGVVGFGRSLSVYTLVGAPLLSVFRRSCSFLASSTSDGCWAKATPARRHRPTAMLNATIGEPVASFMVNY